MRFDKKELLWITKKRLDNPDFQIPIKRKEKPTFRSKPSERKILYIDEYTRKGKLTPKVRNLLLSEGRSIMQSGGSDLDDTLSDEELIDCWNEWVTTERYKFDKAQDWYEEYQLKDLEKEQEIEKRKGKH